MNAARAIDWIKPPSKALFDENAPFYQWYADGEVNTCYNALDRHVESGRADQIALYYDSPITDTKEKYTYRQMRDLCAQLAGGLQAQGVKKGDRVLIYNAHGCAIRDGLCWHARGLARFIRLFSAGLPRRNSPCGLMMPRQRLLLRPPAG